MADVITLIDKLMAADHLTLALAIALVLSLVLLRKPK